MKESKEKLNMRSGTAAVLIIASLLIAGSLIFIAAQPGEDLSDNEGTLGDVAPYVLQLSDIDSHSRTGNAIVITSLSPAGITNINAAGAITLSGMAGGDYIKDIAPGVFEGTEITSIDLRSGLESEGLGLQMVDDAAFKDCVKLKSVIVGDTVKEFGDGAFEGCIMLSTMTLPVKGSPLNPTGSDLEIIFGAGCFDNAILFNWEYNVIHFKGWAYWDGTEWTPFIPTIWTGPSVSSFTIRPLWEEGKIITFKSGLTGVDDVSIMKIVGTGFALSAAYQQACALDGEAANYFESNNLNRVIYNWTSAERTDPYEFSESFVMPDHDVTFSVVKWSIKPGGDDSGKKDGPFGLDGTFFWLLILLIIILLAILAAYLVSKRRRQHEDQ